MGRWGFSLLRCNRGGMGIMMSQINEVGYEKTPEAEIRPPLALIIPVIDGKQETISRDGIWGRQNRIK